MSLLWEAVIFFLLAAWTAVLTYFTFKAYQILQYKSSDTSGLRHWSLVRFNPFSDTGGEQSFVIALLNDSGDGLIITSLHGRGVARFYTKKVTKGLADQELSTEEKAALAQALKSWTELNYYSY